MQVEQTLSTLVAEASLRQYRQEYVRLFVVCCHTDAITIIALQHPCIVQVEQALGTPVAQASLEQYRQEYIKLFVDTVRDAYLHTAPWLNFVDTSPSSGLASLEPYVKRCAWSDHVCSLQCSALARKWSV